MKAGLGPLKAGFVVISIANHFAFVAKRAAKDVARKRKIAVIAIVVSFIALGIKLLSMLWALGKGTSVEPTSQKVIATEPTWSLHAGTCRNLTDDVPGHLKLLLSDTGGKLEGYMSISGWLRGSGPLTGRRKGNTIEFSTTDQVSGDVITWKGQVQGNQFAGSYATPANPQNQMPEQSGEWSVTAQVMDDPQIAFQRQFLLLCELALNEPKQTPEGQIVHGAEVLFDAVHPIGTGASILASDVQLVWKHNLPGTDPSDLRSFTLDYVLYWHGPIQTFGWTKLRLTYDYEVGGVTKHEVIESNGITNSDISGFTYDLGFFLGQAALGSLLEGS